MFTDMFGFEIKQGAILAIPVKHGSNGPRIELRKVVEVTDKNVLVVGWDYSGRLKTRKTALRYPENTLVVTELYLQSKGLSK